MSEKMKTKDRCLKEAVFSLMLAFWLLGIVYSGFLRATAALLLMNAAAAAWMARQAKD